MQLVTGGEEHLDAGDLEVTYYSRHQRPGIDRRMPRPAGEGRIDVDGLSIQTLRVSIGTYCVFDELYIDLDYPSRPCVAASRRGSF